MNWGLLAKLGLGAAAIGGAAFTGGASLAALPSIAKMAGGAAQGSANQRLQENQQRLQQQQIQNTDVLGRAALTQNSAATRALMANRDALDRAGVDLQRKGFLQQEPNAQARQAMVGSMLSRLQPLQLSGLSSRVQTRMPKMNSILDALGPDARQAGSRLASRGLSGLQSGGTQFEALPAMQLPPELNLPPATVMALQKSGLLEKILGGVGLAGSLIGGLGALGGGGSPTGSDWQGPIQGGG